MASRPEADPAPDPSRLTLGHFLTDIAARFASRDALVFDGKRTTYAELDSRARELARGLVGAGVVKGTRVALLVANRPEWIVSAFAVGLSGGVLVPVNTFANQEECDYILRHSDASLLLLQSVLLKHRYLEELIDAHPELASGEPGRLRCAALPQLRRIVCIDPEKPGGNVQSLADLRRLAEDVPEGFIERICDEVHPSDDGVIIYTSGTTAHPKGVLHSQRAIVQQGYRFAEHLRLVPEDRVWTAQPFFWTAGISMSLISTLAAGACLILQESFEPGRALDLIEEERATTAHAWAHQDKALADHPSSAKRDLTSLTKVNFRSQLGRLAGVKEDKWGPGGSYGLSETFTICSSVPSDAPVEIRSGTSGRPLAGMVVRIVDPTTGEPVPMGQAGEIAVKGVTLMKGYYKVLPEEYLDGNGFFRTQDAGSIDEEGFLHWTGRISNMIKTGGANVSPVEIERQLEAYKELRVGLAVGVPHPTLGEAVVLCAVRAAGSTITEQGVRRYLRTKLASYKVPKCVLFFTPQELSYTGNQKIQVGPLREAALVRLISEGVELDGHVYRAS